MGGNVFTHAHAPNAPAIHTPRMTPAAYLTLKSRWGERMTRWLKRNSYTGWSVGVATEAPGKTDYGDVDFYILQSEDTMVSFDFPRLASELGAKGVVVHCGYKASFAVVLDEDGWTEDGLHDRDGAVVYTATSEPTEKGTQGDVVEAEEERGKQVYAQLDVELVPAGSAEWYPFYSAYSDMAQILGRILRSSGFRISDQGFYLRMAEWKQARDCELDLNIPEHDGLVLLTGKWTEMCSFLHMDNEQLLAGFETLDKLYEWLSTCRFLDIAAERNKMAKASKQDRRPTRPVFTRFFEEWLPTHGADLMQSRVDAEQIEECNQDAAVARAIYVEEAIVFFDKTETYQRKRFCLKRDIANAKVVALLRPLVAQASGKASSGVKEIVRAFRRNVVRNGDDGRPRLREEPLSDSDSTICEFLDEDGKSLRDPSVLIAWLEDNWQSLRERERQRAKLVGDRRCGGGSEEGRLIMTAQQ